MDTIPAKSIVTRTKDSGWFGTEYNMNIYRGCCHGCIYCDSRSDCYRIEEFDRVRAKADALRIIRDDLRRKVKAGVVATGSMSDPYNPFETREQLTRHALELLDAYGFGVAIATKGTLVVRDTDILQSIAGRAPVLVKITITCVDDALAAKLEPGAPPPSERFRALRELSRAGIFCGVLLMPVLPFLEDSEENVLGVLRQASASGARFVYPAFGMTMRAGQREWFYRQLEERFPGEGLAVRYQARYGGRYQCTSPRAKLLWEAFQAECEKLGMLYRMTDIIRAYRQGYAVQLSLFDGL